MKRCEKYRNSGVKWIGEIPNNWECKRLKFVDAVIMGQSPNSDDYNHSKSGLPFLQGNADFGSLNPEPQVWCETANKTSIRNDILLSVRAPIGAVNLADREYGIGRGLCAIRSRKSHFKFLYYQLLTLSEELNSIGTGSTYTAISVDEVNNLFCLFPPLPEQRTIADYLDRKTAQIDDFITKKQKLIELLKEERTALINHAVTKGLDPKAKMKPSGIEWLGDIPAHWAIMRLKFVFWLSRGVDLSSDKFQDGPFPVMGSNGPIGFHNEFTTKGPGITIGRSGSAGEVNFVANDFWAHNTCIYVQKNYGNDIEFLYFLLKSMDIKHLSGGSVVGSLDRNHLHRLLIAVPPAVEQKEIVNTIIVNTNRIDRTISTIEKEIELIQEYRTALISEAVTGKIDVRSEVQI